MKKINKNFKHPSSAFTIKKSQVRFYEKIDKIPEEGDVIYGKVIGLGQHNTLENVSGRIHKIFDGTKSVFVFGNRYAPDHYEAVVPDENTTVVDMVARSGVVGKVLNKNCMISDPTTIEILGYVYDKNEKLLNTKDYPIITPEKTEKKSPRAKMILSIGTSMNSGKSLAAEACCWALSSKGKEVRGSKITGTASLKDILYMNDAGASHYTDFTHFGYPSTYLSREEDLLNIFNKTDLKYANNPKNFWVVEFADGIGQRETSILLKSKCVRDRIYKLIFCSNDAYGAIGGLIKLKENFGLTPDVISGVCSSSPLHIRELQEFTNIPILNSFNPNTEEWLKIIS